MAASLWVVRRLFLMSRRRWAGVLVAAITADLLAWIFAPPAVALVLLAPPFLIVAVLGHWAWLGRGSGPIVFVSLFEGRSRLGREAAETHLGALAAFLREDPNLAALGGVQIREVPIALGTAQAERLLRISGALMVIRGSGDAVAELSRWEWWAHFRQQLPELMITRYEFSLLHNEIRRSALRRLGAVAPVSAAHDAEGDLALASFVADSIEISHFRSLGKALCVLTSELRRAQAGPGERIELLLPEPADSELPRVLEGRVAIMEAGAALSQGGDHLAVLEMLQMSSETGLGDESFGIWLEAQWFAASVERRIDKDRALREAMKTVERFPGDHLVLLNAAGLALEARELDLAQGLIDRCDPAAREDPNHPRVRANLAWIRGEPAVALALYREASRTGPPQTWQMGDCQRALGHPRRALRLYRKALRRDSTANMALRNARDVVRIPRLLPTMPGGWRRRLWTSFHRHPRLVSPLLWLWRRRLPEDPWLPAWLARHAIVLDDLEVARRWIILTQRIEETNRLMVSMDALIVGALRHEGDLPRSVENLRAHIGWLDERLAVDVRQDGRAALERLRRARPDIFSKGEEAAEICAMFSELGLMEISGNP